MKKIFLLAAMALMMSLSFTSCEKDEIGGTATQEMAGDWYVTVTAVDDEGNTVFSDDELFGLGRIHMLTFNTNDNVANKMYVYDEGNFWGFKVQTSCNQSSKTFATSGAAVNESGDEIEVTITDGKILPKAGRQNNGSAADSIVFYVNFSDDTYPEAYGYAKYKVSGVRYSGLTEND